MNTLAGRLRFAVPALAVLAVWAAAPTTAAARDGGETAPKKPPTARELLDRVDDMYRSRSSFSRFSMTVKTEHWERSLRLEAWTKGKDHSLIRILSPKREKGTSTLRAGKEIWNYLPKIKRVIKLPSSMMGGSWMGSHFTNDDLVKESRMADDYSFAIVFNGERRGRKVVDIVCKPKPGAPVVWGKVLVSIDMKTLLPMVDHYYDEDMNLARTLTFSEVKKLGGRLAPSVMTMVPADKPKERTEVRYEKIDFDIDIPDSIFTLRNLRRGAGRGK